MIIAVLKEQFSGESRVALVPSQVSKFTKAGHSIIVEKDAGLQAGYPDSVYVEKGAEIVSSRADLFAKADVIAAVRFAAASGDSNAKDYGLLKKGQMIISTMDAYDSHESFKKINAAGASAFALELIPRITRAQSMDVLSSMANLAGYKAGLLAADNLLKMFPMMMTAAGTLVPAKVFIIGVGVAGLQAIATTKRLGALVSAYDVRSAVKEQVQSLGAKFVEMDLGTETAEGSGGYAKAMDEEFYKKQQAFMKGVIAESDVVITTAAIPGKKSPVLVTAEMVQAMAPGSVIVDLAVERGGNCELSEAGKTVVKHGVTIVGPVNIASELSFNASQLYGKNWENFFFSLFTKEGELNLDKEDEIIAATMLCEGGSVQIEEKKHLFE